MKGVAMRMMMMMMLLCTSKCRAAYREAGCRLAQLTEEPIIAYYYCALSIISSGKSHNLTGSLASSLQVQGLILRGCAALETLETVQCALLRATVRRVHTLVQ